ncbi:MAG: hypothetical protein HW403_1521 [Dehalococcoidia bacterium]|nr:hypothetical protein [Dehalococcoidia bacterium]
MDLSSRAKLGPACRKQNHVIVLVITADRSIPQELQGMVGAQGTVFWKPWSDLYIWLKSNNNGFLGRELIAYLELLEYKLHREGDSNVALTGFTGIPFGAEHPYNSIEAYAQLMSLVQALRSSEKLVHVYPHFSAEGRGNIEQDRPDVWDVLQMYPVPKDTKKKNWKFNNAPHFIIWLSREGLHIGVTLPNADKTGGWRRVTTSPHSLGNALGQVQSSAQHSAGKPSCFVALIQRHLPPKMPPRASNLKTDGRIEFDLDTFLPEQLDNKVKPKQGWYDAITNLLQSKGPENLELHLDLRYSYLSSSSSRILKSAQFIEESVDACIALHPWYRFLTESNVYKRTPA